MNEHIYRRLERRSQDRPDQHEYSSWAEQDGDRAEGAAIPDADALGFRESTSDEGQGASAGRVDPESEWRAIFQRELAMTKPREELGEGDHQNPDPASSEPTGYRADGDRAYRRLPAPRSQTLPAPRDARERLPDRFTPNADYAAPSDEGPGLDLRKYLWLLFKHRWLLLGATILCTGIGAISTFLTTPIYRATASIQISRDVPQIVSGTTGGDVTQVDGGQSYEFLQNQYELLRSRAIAERVVTSLSLQDDQTFLSSSAPSPLSNLKRLVFGAPAQSQNSASGDVAGRQKAAAGKVMGGMGLQPVNNSTIVRITYDSPNPGVAVKVANGIIDAFIAENLDRRYGAATYARKFLEDRLQQIKLKLEESEKQLVAYADKQKIVGAADGQTLSQTNLTTANDALTKATSERLRLELLWKQVQSGEGMGVPQMLESKAIADLRTKRADLQTAYQDKLSFFKPAYPEMKKLKAQIDEIDRQIDGEVELIKQSIKAQYDSAIVQEQTLMKQMDSLKGDITDFRNRNIQYTILQREVDTNRSLYDGLLQRYKEIGVAGGVGTNNVAVVDRADGAGVVSPDLKKNLSMSLMLGLLLGAAAAFGREQLDDTFKSPEDLEDSLGVPLLGIIPVARSSAEHVKLLEDPHSAVSEAYRSLRTALQFSTSAGVPKTLLVTSARAGEGKSTTAFMLARNYAQVGLKVLLIDADLRKPSLHRYFKCDVTVGLTNCLASAAVPPAVFQKTSVNGLTFMPSGPLPPNPAELLAGPKMLALLTAAAESYDVVILDGPPVAGLADGPLLSSVAAGTLYVIDGTKTRRNVAIAALKRLHFARAQVVGAVINKLNTHSVYGYGYGHGGDHYYGDRAQIIDGRGAATARG